MFHSYYQITRAELYEKVWASPMLKVAEEIGVSDVALGKACRRAGIPVPPQGYWLRKGKSAARPALPKSPNGRNDFIEFRVIDRAELERFRAKVPASAALPPGIPSPVVPETLHGAHPLVLATKRRGTDHFHGRLYLQKESLDLRVSPDQLQRCQRIASALIKTSESLGYRWRVEDGETRVFQGDTHFQVHFIERISKQPSTSKARFADATWVPTGELAFVVDTYTPEPVRKLWKDSGSGALEGRLGDVVATFPAIIEGIRLHRAQLQEWRRSCEEAREREARAAENAARLRGLRDRLAQATTAWENAQRIRSFCEAVSSRIAGMAAEDRDAAISWLEWATDQADALDPFKRAPFAWMSLAGAPAQRSDSDQMRGHWWGHLEK